MNHSELQMLPQQYILVPSYKLNDLHRFWVDAYSLFHFPTYSKQKSFKEDILNDR